MNITISKATAEAFGFKQFTPFGLSKESWNWRGDASIDLRAMKDGQVDALDCLLATKSDLPGVTRARRDIKVWQEAKKDATKLKPRTIRHFETLLTEYLLKVPGPRLYDRCDTVEDVWLPYHVNEVRFHPEQKGRDGYTPAHVTMDLVHESFGGQREQTVTFYGEHLQGTVIEILARKGYYAETPSLRAAHLATIERFNQVHSLVGTQFLCSGVAMDDPDGNKEKRRDSWYYRSTQRVPMVRNGEAARVVVDIFYEEGSSRDRSVHLHTRFWPSVAAGRKRTGDDDDDDDQDGGDDDIMDMIQVPIHPWLVVFDLTKHLRLRVHVSQLSEYVYDRNLADKLVLSEDRKALVRMLIDLKSGGFQDIVHGKGGGAVVLLAGPPGTGKTLTAEVYAESEGRALYSIQCSQLGTDPDTLEDQLLQVFARSRRWNAVMLLDEADVYVHERGNDMDQNAIVGVFLRVLEYQDSVLFLTTNRPDDVDDAIASRCIARLTYELPNADDQRRIWRVLADATKTPIGDQAIRDIVTANPTLSGRDVKNLLKLARLICPEDITPDAIEFVKQFKATKAIQGGPVTMPGGIHRCPTCGVLVGRKGHDCPRKGGR